MIGTYDHITVKGTIPFSIKKNAILNIVTNDVTSYTHGFHKYPSKFIPHVPRWAISKYLNGRKEGLIFDPFCGSGTTLVEGILSGNNVVGIDIDPLSTLISKVKTTPIDIVRLNEVCDWISDKLRAGKQDSFRTECPNINHWFTSDAIAKLSLIRSVIDQIIEHFGQNDQSKDIQDLLYVCFSSILRRVSNADNESQKTYVSHTKIKLPEETMSLFLSQLNYFKVRINEFSACVNSKLRREIICTSSTNDLNSKLGEKNIDIVITSPPYIKAIDYIYNQMVELFWIGDLFDMQTQTKQNNKKKHYTGTKHLSKKDYSEYNPIIASFGINKLDAKLNTIFTHDKKNGRKHAFITAKYFNDMEEHFKELANSLNPGVHYVMVVGASSVSNVLFETDEFLSDIAERNDFTLMDKWGYQIKNRYMRFDRKGKGGIIDVDWILDFVKT